MRYRIAFEFSVANDYYATKVGDALLDVFQGFQVADVEMVEDGEVSTEDES